MQNENHYDVGIIGGGPAGLNAALVLGRARKNVILIDNDQPRNGVTHASHGFITRDGVTPAEFRRIAYEEVLRYPSVRHRKDEAADIQRTGQGFRIRTSSGGEMYTRRLILSAGLKDELPDIQGVRDFYGKSIFVCPFCDGWEMRDQPLALISNLPGVVHGAKLLYNWSKDIVVCTNGGQSIPDDQRFLLASRGIRIVDSKVAALTGREGKLEEVHFEDGTSIARSGAFIGVNQRPSVNFAQELGYETEESGAITTDELGRTTVAGLYAAGDSAYVMPSQLIYAAATGSKAAMAVMADILEEEWRQT